MRALIVTLLLSSLTACSDSYTTINNPATASSTSGTTSSNDTTSGVGGAGGEGGMGGAASSTSATTGGVGGAGGQGGAPCTGLTCDEIPGSCGLINNGCNIIDCTAPCDDDPANLWLTCSTLDDGTGGTCQCADAPVGVDVCETHPDALAWCGDACIARFCGEPPQPNAPASCIYVADIGLAAWCCKAD